MLRNRFVWLIVTCICVAGLFVAYYGFSNRHPEDVAPPQHTLQLSGPILRVQYDSVSNMILIKSEKGITVISAMTYEIVSEWQLENIVDYFIVENPAYRYVVVQNDGEVLCYDNQFKYVTQFSLSVGQISTVDVRRDGTLVSAITGRQPSTDLFVVDLIQHRIVLTRKGLGASRSSFSGLESLLVTRLGNGLLIYTIATDESVTVDASFHYSYACIVNTGPNAWTVVPSTFPAVFTIANNTLVQHGHFDERFDIVTGDRDGVYIYTKPKEGTAYIKKVNGISLVTLKTMTKTAPPAFCVCEPLKIIVLGHHTGRIEIYSY